MPPYKIFTGLLLVATVWLAGCSSNSVRWYHPDRTLREVKADCKECHYQARTEATTAAYEESRDRSIVAPKSSRGGWAAYRETQFTKCMKDKGYVLTQDVRLKSSVKKRLYEVDNEYYSIAGK